MMSTKLFCTYFSDENAPHLPPNYLPSSYVAQWNLYFPPLYECWSTWEGNYLYTKTPWNLSNKKKHDGKWLFTSNVMAKMSLDIFFVANCLACLEQRYDAFTDLGHASVIVQPVYIFSTFPSVSFSLTNLFFCLHSTRSLSLSIFIETLIPQRFLRTCQIRFQPFYPDLTMFGAKPWEYWPLLRLRPQSWDRSRRAFCIHPSEGTAFTNPMF